MSILRKRNRRKPKARRQFALPAVDWRRVGRGALAAGALAALGGLVAAGLDQPIHRVRLEGSFQRVTPVEVEQAVRSALEGGLMTVDLERLRAAGEELA